jgi:hypothetical protein
MVFNAKDQFPSRWAAIESIASMIGRTGETPLNSDVRKKSQRFTGLRGSKADVQLSCNATILKTHRSPWFIPYRATAYGACIARFATF